MTTKPKKLFYMPLRGAEVFGGKAWKLFSDRQRVSFMLLDWEFWMSPKPGYLENDDEVLWKLVQAPSKRRWLADKPVLLRHAFKLTADADYIYSEYIVTLWQEQRERADSNHERAKKGGEARAKKAQIKLTTSSDQACLQPASQKLEVDSKLDPIPRSPLPSVQDEQLLLFLTERWTSAQQHLKSELSFEEYEACIRDTFVGGLDADGFLHFICNEPRAARLLPAIREKILRHFPSSIRGIKAETGGEA